MLAGDEWYDDAEVSLGKTEDAAIFEKQASKYRNVRDKRAGRMRPCRMDGSWYEPPEEIEQDYL